MQRYPAAFFCRIPLLFCMCACKRRRIPYGNAAILRGAFEFSTKPLAFRGNVLYNKIVRFDLYTD